jgi:hypothetical protein
MTQHTGTDYHAPATGKNAVRAHRRRARSVVDERVGRDVFLAAQGFVCPFCNLPLSEIESTIDHVFPMSKRKRNAGNIVLMHELCNQIKNNRLPSTKLKQALNTVNACLQFDPEVQRYGCSFHPVRKEWNRTFPDPIEFDINAAVNPGKFMLDTFRWVVFKVLT